MIRHVHTGGSMYALTDGSVLIAYEVNCLERDDRSGQN